MFSGVDRNLFVITGQVSRLVVLDCDDLASVKYWREILGPAMERTARVRTGKGHHFYFTLEPGQAVKSRSSRDPDCQWDLRGDGGGVVAPGSVHESGRRYEWAEGHGLSALERCPKALFSPSSGAAGANTPGEGRSALSGLLSAPPSGEGNRNVWLAQVAGHYAKHIPFRDAFEVMVRQAAGLLQPPLPEDEIAKMLDSIWGAEEAKGQAPEIEDLDEEAWRTGLLEPREENGWLVSGKTCLMVQTREKDGDGHWQTGLARWMDADLQALGVVESEHGRVYEVRVYRPDEEPVEAALPASTIADPRQLGMWLANLGVSIGPPDNIHPSRMRESARLVRYLEAQDAEVLIAADSLGWNFESESFITHDGIIRATGPGPFEHVRADPTVKRWAPYRYGHSGREEARQILREILSFHDETVAAVFGSWWSACLLKPQIQTVSSQFPFMALEAASESGKSTGFFSLMLQLSGNTGGNSNPTRAALRDYLSAHNAGITWVDDLDSLENLGELLRNVTVGGSMVKKGADNSSQVVARMRGALVVSGEALGLDGQKALLDRAILLEVPSPIGRKSLRYKGRPQWDDVLDLRKRFPDLTDYAGSMVEMALEIADIVDDFKSLRPGAGRFADKLAVLRIGSRILDELTGGMGGLVDLVDHWTQDADDAGSENALTMRLLPFALARTGWQKAPQGPQPDRKMVATPAFVQDDGTVWFSPRLLADWWEREPPMNKRLDPRVDSATALEQQARAMGMGGAEGVDRKRFRFVTGEGKTVYWRMPTELSRSVVNRSRGIQEGDVIADGDNQSGELL